MLPRAVASMSATKHVAVVGAGVAGLVCASSLAKQGIKVSVFEGARGPGGRMATRREKLPDGREVAFDHGAQYFTVSAANPEVVALVEEWRGAGLVGVWGGRLGTLEAGSAAFSPEPEGTGKTRYVGFPGMSAICKALEEQPGITARFGVRVGSLRWDTPSPSTAATTAPASAPTTPPGPAPPAPGCWLLHSAEGELLGSFDGVACADKSLARGSRMLGGGGAAPLDGAGVPTLQERMAAVAANPSFAVMVAFAEPLKDVPFQGASVAGSTRLAWVAVDSSKPGRATGPGLPELWVLHSTAEYARLVIDAAPPGKPSAELLETVSRELIEAFREVVPQAMEGRLLFSKAHRWGGAFPTSAAAPDSGFLVDEARCLVACGDFCTGPKVEQAVASGLSAAMGLSRILSLSKM